MFGFNKEEYESGLVDLFKRFEGGVSFEEFCFLVQLASKVLEGCIVEIGSFRGKSAVALALGARRNPYNKKPKIYCIEPHRKFRGYYGGKFGPEDREAFYRTVLEAKVSTDVALVNLESDLVGPAWREPIGLLFIDGDHRYESVKRDFQCWEPHIVAGGIIAFDDSTDPRGGPSRVITEIMKTGRFQYITTVGKITVIRKIQHDLNLRPITPQHILVITAGFPLSGGLLRFERVGRILRDWGHEVVWVDLANKEESMRKWKPLLPVLSLRQAMDTRWDAVMLPGAGFPVEILKALAVFQKKNFGTRIQHVLNDQTRRSLFKMANHFFRPHVVIFNNDHWPVGSYIDLNADRFHVLVGGVDTSLFHPPTYKSHPFKPTKWIIGGLASKNPEPLVSALKFMPADVSIWLYGEDSHNLADKFVTYIHHGRLRLLGTLDGKALCEFYHNVDCVVMTETYAGWSNLVAEAMASGTPVICTPHGTSRIARHGETAIVIGYPDPVAIAKSVLRLKNDPHLCKKLSDNARRVILNYSWDKYCRQLLKLIKHDGQRHYTYDPSSGLYGKWSISQRLSGLKPLLDLTHDLSVLDLGAAEGVIAREFLKRGAKVVHGFDVDPGKIAIAQALCGKWRNAVFRCVDLSNLDEFFRTNCDILQNSYDIILYLGIHHHLPADSRLKLFSAILRMASKYIAIRTSTDLYAKDSLEKHLLFEGFHQVNVSAKEKTEWGDMGELRIYEKKPRMSSSRIISRHFVSYPKSGRTWIRYILNQLKVDGYILFHHDGFEFNDGSCPPHDFDIERRLKFYAKVDRLVYLERDPRDVMVSLYAQITGRFRDFFNYKGSISDFIRDPYFGAHNLQKFRIMWNYLVEQFGFLKITYEECHEDMESVIIKVLDYYGLQVPKDKIAKAVENARFEKMQRLEQSEAFPHPWLRPRNNAPKVRKGKIGSFREELSIEDIEYLNQIFFPTVSGSNLLRNEKIRK